MPRVSISVAEFGERCEEVHSLLAPIAAKTETLHVQAQADGSGGKLIVASDGFSSGETARDRRFRTKCDQLLGQYYEIWMPQARGRFYHMTHCYFHFFYVTRRDEPDYIFGLHAEPEHQLDKHIDQCKAGPHIHLSVHERRLSPISNGHLPLFFSSLETVLKSKSEFDRAMKTAMSIVEREVLGSFVAA
jgi:hypothetical protein